jgi:hypothetical protein
MLGSALGAGHGFPWGVLGGRVNDTLYVVVY